MLSQLIGDKKTSEVLAAHAADLFERADAIERENCSTVPQAQATSEQPAQQQQQIQPGKSDGE
jgi:hypothetical protein